MLLYHQYNYWFLYETHYNHIHSNVNYRLAKILEHNLPCRIPTISKYIFKSYVIIIYYKFISALK